MISSIVLYGLTQPDFEKLKDKGWINPLGLRDEPLEKSLTKTFCELEFHICKHNFIHSKCNGETYTEIFLSHPSMEYNKPLLKGDGTPFTMEDIHIALAWLEQELS